MTASLAGKHRSLTYVGQTRILMTVCIAVGGLECVINHFDRRNAAWNREAYAEEGILRERACIAAMAQAGWGEVGVHGNVGHAIANGPKVAAGGARSALVICCLSHL